LTLVRRFAVLFGLGLALGLGLAACFINAGPPNPHKTADPRDVSPDASPDADPADADPADASEDP
jgi:hypothetical protein